jgi:hypothetical protein
LEIISLLLGLSRCAHVFGFWVEVLLPFILCRLGRGELLFSPVSQNRTKTMSFLMFILPSSATYSLVMNSFWATPIGLTGAFHHRCNGWL